MEKNLCMVFLQNENNITQTLWLFADSLRDAIFQVESNWIKDLHPKSNKLQSNCKMVYEAKIYRNDFEFWLYQK